MLNKIYSFFVRKLDNKTISEDLTSKVFESCFKAYQKNLDDQKLTSQYIFTIAKNTLKNYFRDHKNEFNLDQIENKISDNESINIDQALDQKIMVNQIRLAVEKLTAIERDVLNLRYFADLKYHEISQILNITPTYVRVVHHRAIINLSKFFPK